LQITVTADGPMDAKMPFLAMRFTRHDRAVERVRRLMTIGVCAIGDAGVRRDNAIMRAKRTLALLWRCRLMWWFP
jgi:uncharacterized protein YoaH (UPF0181 family)